VKRLLLATFVGGLVYSIAFASAASIGTVSDAGVGAGKAVVAACDSDGVNSAYTTAYTTNVGYTVTTVNVTGIATGCNGKAIQVTVAQTDGTVPASGAGTVSSGAASIAVSPAVPAANVAQIFVEIG
jgi:hypothetical protein